MTNQQREPNSIIDTLEELAVEARKSFSPSVFWTIPVSMDPVTEARNVASQLEKHGGLRGVLFAARIEDELLKAGASSWR
jgi:hypothetical protein